MLGIHYRLQDATPGPWIAEDIGAGTTAWGVRTAEGLSIVEHDFVAGNNARFIAHAREDVEYLLLQLAECTRARAQAEQRNQQLQRRVKIAIRAGHIRSAGERSLRLRFKDQLASGPET